LTAEKTLAVIPARYASSRFPAKPLADLGGHPMIWHVVQRALQAKRLDQVIVATEDERIARVVRSFGNVEVVLTSSTHQTGSDRVAEVAASRLASLVVNLQGDLPLFDPAVLDRLIERGGVWIESGEADVVTLKAKVDSEESFFSPNTVKLVSNRHEDVLYFSRSPIPHTDKKPFVVPAGAFKHYGVYLYHRDFLLKMAKRSEGILERAERLEQLRVMEDGGRIRAIEITQEESQWFCEVNVPEDIETAKKILLTVS
jgi:3-deoxy-manno-octulosonate cytidylyltransferase (CMP-KDO synthetase)